MVEAADCFLEMWHKSDDKGKGRGGGNRTDTALDERKNEMLDHVARYRFDSSHEWNVCYYISPLNSTEVVVFCSFVAELFSGGEARQRQY